MKKLLQIDTCLGVGSTGRITESIAKLAQARGWECYIVHGGRYVKRPSCMQDIQSVSPIGEYLHYAESLLRDNHGLASRRATLKVVEKIKRIQPDVVQLHCIHGYYLNYKILFEYLNKTNTPVVWTFHDCWVFTGHCSHFVTARCEKWKTGCYDCPLKGSYPKSLVDSSRRNYKLKKNLFGVNKNLHIVSVSDWMAGFVKESFLKDKDMRVIKNGVDLNVFKPSTSTDDGKISVLGVSGVWNKGKGLYDFYRLRELLDDNYEIILVGLNKEQIKELPPGIVGIEHTDSVQELARLYSSASVFVNPTYADTFPTVNLEALACGTPVITYRTGGSPETVTLGTGWVLEQGDVMGIASVIRSLELKDITEIVAQRLACRERAEQEFNKDICFEKYIELYEGLVINKPMSIECQLNGHLASGRKDQCQG